MQYLGIMIHIFYLLPAALILVAAILLQDKIKSGLTTLLIVGQTAVLVGGILSLGLQILLHTRAIDPRQFAQLWIIPSLVSVVGGLVFGFGLLAVARDIVSVDTQA